MVCFNPRYLSFNDIAKFTCSDFIGQTFSHIYTVVALVECKSASTHEQASEKLELAHKFIDSRSHNSCCDWFHCLLQIKSLLLSDDSSDAVNYYNGEGS